MNYEDTSERVCFLMNKSKKKVKLNKKNHQGEGGGTKPREFYYQQATKYASAALEEIVWLMTNGDNDNVRLGAAKTILAKVIPDLSSTEIKGDGQGLIQLFINAGSGFIPASLGLPTSPTRGITTGQSPIQSNGLAQES